MKKHLSKYSKLLIPFMFISFNSIQASESKYSCSEGDYTFKQCKFDVPDIEHGSTKLLTIKSGIFDGKALILCNNGKRTIISESCDYVQGAEDSCKGIPSNSWTGSEDAMCQHSELSISVANGDEYKVNSTLNNGFMKYECVDSELKVKSNMCERPVAKATIKTASVGSQCVSKTYAADAEYDYVTKEWKSIPPNDTFCINSGFDYLDSYSDTSTNLQSLHKGTFEAVCCSNDTLDSPTVEMTVNPLDSDRAVINGVIAGDYNEITGVASNTPSNLKVLNSMCKPNGYSKLDSYTADNIVVGDYTYVDEFNITAFCSGNNSIADNNTECKGAFLSSGANAENEARALGIPYLCDSSSGKNECYQNTCTPFVVDEDLCEECNLDNFTFEANNNHCTVDFNSILSGHNNKKKFYNDTHSGYADVNCNNGNGAVEDARCFNNCLEKRITWENKDNNAVCYYDLPNAKYRHYLEPTDNDRRNPDLEIGDRTNRIKSVINTGLGDFHCDDGEWKFNTEDLIEPICFASCNAQTGTWGYGTSKDGRDKTNACSANLLSASHFLTPDYNSAIGVDPMSNATEAPTQNVTSINNFGSANFRCNNGSFQAIGDQSCNLSCLPQTVSWTVNGVTASANVGGTPHNEKLLNVKAQGLNSGQGTTDRSNSSYGDFICDDGLYVQLNTSTVYKDCEAGSLKEDSANYSDVCDFSWNTMRHGDTGLLNANGFGSGSASYSCENGQIKLSNITCDKNCEDKTVSWGRSSGVISACNDGYTKIGNLCRKESIENPTCPFGYIYDNDENQCTKKLETKNYFPGYFKCEGNYSGYSVFGDSCEKKYIESPICASNHYFDGEKCLEQPPMGSIDIWKCPAYYEYKENYFNNGLNYTNVCIKEIYTSPNCATGYSWNSSKSICETNSLTDPKLSCDKNSDEKLTKPVDAKASYIPYETTKSRCQNNSINGYCCFDAMEEFEYEVSIMTPRKTCETGTYNNVSQKCQVASSKPATCNSGYTLSGSNCVKKEVIDATKECQGNCKIIEYPAMCASYKKAPNGDELDFEKVNGSCEFNHKVNNVATTDCGALTGNVSVVGGMCVQTNIYMLYEAPKCENGGILNTYTDKCVALETQPANFDEPISCSASTTSITHTGIRNVTDTSNDGATGSAELTCNDGKWIVGENSCNKDCSPIVPANSWSTGETLNSDHAAFEKNNCQTSSFYASNNVHGTSIDKTAKSNLITTGEVTYKCVDGTWESENQYCTRKSCDTTSGEKLSWTASRTCTVPAPSNMKWGDAVTIYQPIGYSGDKQAEFECSDSGIGLISNGDCNQDCNVNLIDKTYFWGNGSSTCSANFSNYLEHNKTSSITDVSSSTRGTATLVCSQGRIIVNGTCTRITPANLDVTWNNNCSAKTTRELDSTSWSMSNKCEVVQNQNGNGYTGNATVCADGQGSYIVSNATCEAPKRDCSSKLLSWDNCFGSANASKNGESVIVTNDIFSSYSGSVKATCNDGSWLLSEQSCDDYYGTNK